MSLKEVDRQINNAQPKQKLHDFSKYVGKIKLKQDPLVIQREMRDEWE